MPKKYEDYLKGNLWDVRNVNQDVGVTLNVLDKIADYVERETWKEAKVLAKSLNVVDVVEEDIEKGTLRVELVSKQDMVDKITDHIVVDDMQKIQIAIDPFMDLIVTTFKPAGTSAIVSFRNPHLEKILMKDGSEEGGKKYSAMIGAYVVFDPNQHEEALFKGYQE